MPDFIGGSFRSGLGLAGRAKRWRARFEPVKTSMIMSENGSQINDSAAAHRVEEVGVGLRGFDLVDEEFGR
jgi:hypothetical protein